MYNTKLCNSCPHLVRTPSSVSEYLFDTACNIVSYEAFGVTRQRRIDTSVKLIDEIQTPHWCPKNKPTEAQQPKQEEPTYLTYSERREKMKLLKRNIQWKDIKEGEVYVIPKILNQARKLVKVMTKSDLSCVCHEINENTGNEYSYNVTFYPSDLDAIFINKIHNF